MSDFRDEFLSEAQEIIEALSRDLLLLDQAQKEGSSQHDLINEVFRGVHTLKGIAGMFGYVRVGSLAHSLEDLLDGLRLGKVQLDAAVLDLLFEGVENFQRLLGETEDAPEVDMDRFQQKLGGVGEALAPAGDVLDDYDIDPNVLAVLTEYEEHRLRTNVAGGVSLFRLRAHFSLTTIDSQLEDLKNRAKMLAEIITYLPSASASDGDGIDLDILLASSATYEQLLEALAVRESELAAVVRRDALPGGGSNTAPPPPMDVVPDGTIFPSPRKSSTGRPPEGIPEIEVRELSADQLSLRSVANTVRVDIRKLDHLMNVVGELAIVRGAVARLTERIRQRPELRTIGAEMHRMNRSFERHLETLQEGILDVRMVPLGQVFDKLARVVRQVAREHDKQVRLLVSGAETEVDKLIVEELSDPLMHLIRNAIDHGIEPPKVRELAEKHEGGTLSLNAYQKGRHVVIEIEDDGAGMNPRRLVETALRKGLITEEAAADLAPTDVLGLIFMAGFSTRSTITDLSGRGVGMDVVKTNISRLGGVIDVQSEFGIGTKFTITLPVTLAIINALLVEVADRQFAIPITSVQEAILLDPAKVRMVEGREVMTLRGATLPICRLDVLFGLPRTSVERRFVVVSAVGARRIGFVVDVLSGQQDIVIKSLGKSLSKVRGFAGATDLGDQRVALVIDAPGLLEEVLSTADLIAKREALS